MAYTLSSVRNRVLDDKLDDPTFDPNIVDGFINDAQRAIFNTYELPFMEKVFRGTLPADGYIFTFPVDYQLEQSMVVVGPDGQKHDITDNYVDFREFNKAYPVPEIETVGPPAIWTLHGGKLYFSRKTDQEYTLSLFYIKTPLELEDDADVPEIPEEFQEVLILGAYQRILARNEDFDQADYVLKELYVPALDLMAQRLSKRQTGKTRTIGQPLRIGRRSRGRA